MDSRRLRDLVIKGQIFQHEYKKVSELVDQHVDASYDSKQ